MSTLYRPVLIEFVEQAEALPVGTVAVFPGEPSAAARVAYGCGWAIAAEEMSYDHAYMIDWTALVPIEAEEVRAIASGGLERDQHGATVLNHTPDGPRRDYRRTEFHTPWEAS